jgi:AAA15 family ATPase/GTPase
MLIEFSVSNYRSFRERQTLSMVASSRVGAKENTFAPELAGEKFPALLKAAAIYGPNASGKSNLLRALGMVSRLARRTPSPHLPPLPVSPFKFDKALAEEPSTFDLHFVRGGLRYAYELSATATRVVNECLFAYPKGKETPIYERRWNKGTETYSFGEALIEEAGTDVVDTWRKLTPPTLLFISQAVANSSSDIALLRAPFEWLSDATLSLMNGPGSLALSAQAMIAEMRGGEAVGDALASFLRELDVPISKIKVSDLEDVERFDAPEVQATQPATLTFGGEKRRASNRWRTTLTHMTALGEADIDFVDESQGTKNLFGFWLPWVTRDHHDLHSRCILQVDEIDSSLHPVIVEALVQRHISAESVSQLIFTTHDTHLMDTGLLRRDQIWITERDANGATQLRSVHDFKGRQGEDVEKRYFEGRYRGLPLTRG